MKRSSAKHGDWPRRLYDFIESDHRFDWGKYNCALFCAGAIEAMTGWDYAREYMAQDGKSGALRELIRLGGDLGSVATKYFGEPLDNINLAQRGDLALIAIMTPDDGIDDALGIHMGNNIVALGDSGIVFYKLDDIDIKKVWRV